MNRLFLIGFALLAGCGAPRQAAPPAWGPAVSNELRALGFGNWIIVAEASFPVHSGRGVRTVVVDAEIPEVVDYIVDSYDHSENVRPGFNTARELPFVENDRAPGVDEFRKRLQEALHGNEVREMDHRSLALLAQNNSGKFAVLVLKTRTTLPYSNVFIELDTGYWDRESDDALRETMRKAREQAPTVTEQ
ncbi:MAG: RbsD/FucU domain-containing protein [Verrucomicrobiaceae bacterium]